MINRRIIEILGNKDNYIIGYADMADLLYPLYEYRYAIVIGRKLDDRIIDSVEDGPNREYFTLYHQVNDELKEAVLNISAYLKEEGIDNYPVKPTLTDKEISADYEETLRSNFSHKMAATRAGIGWIGKTDLLITKKFGPRLRLATILTNSDHGLSGKPVEKSLCGKCRKCVDKCPAGAANGKAWNVTVDRNEFYDAFKCRNMCRELSARNLNEQISICGICVSVCPVGKKNRSVSPGIE